MGSVILLPGGFKGGILGTKDFLCEFILSKFSRMIRMGVQKFILQIAEFLDVVHCSILVGVAEFTGRIWMCRSKFTNLAFNRLTHSPVESLSNGVNSTLYTGDPGDGFFYPVAFVEKELVVLNRLDGLRFCLGKSADADVGSEGDLLALLFRVALKEGKEEVIDLRVFVLQAFAKACRANCVYDKIAEFLRGVKLLGMLHGSAWDTHSRSLQIYRLRVLRGLLRCLRAVFLRPPLAGLGIT